MKTKLGKFFAALSMGALLVSLNPAAIAAHLVDVPEIRGAAPNGAAPSNHEAIARYYEDAATQLQAKVNEQKELLEQYEKQQLYGWQSHKSKSQTRALIRKYEQAARSNMKEAAAHRQMAAGPEERSYATDGHLSPSRNN
ncbi:hypothetical protein SAMN05216420_1245 [Nitrosospira sp. Nl5]|uniref:hypothetical protein n=1 Tax=Nitrosospira sp. Nl5 TaxID=200120 RepID=UPI000881FDE9|nr:hypothetical protein [Nitrosospira sp. Nl5]SCY81358.1 hypothetical protein SAMN05216420_1245 [Nitrosospira sp. Nl5]